MAHRGWKRDGFTPAKKAAALEALGKYGNVTDACRVAGISDTTFYRHWRRGSRRSGGRRRLGSGTGAEALTGTSGRKGRHGRP